MHLKSSYILSADNWIEENIFNGVEEKSWYSCVYKQGPTSEWCVSADTSGKMTHVTVGGHDSWVMYGPVFLTRSFSEKFIEKIETYYRKPGAENYLWENVLMNEMQSFDLYINKQDSANVYEFETLEELRDFDPGYRSGLSNNYITLIEKIFNVKENEISNIKNQKAGMTNRSFTFTINNEEYIFRLPGEGTDKLINRRQEQEVYKAIQALDISDRIIYFDEITGNKISQFYPGAINTSATNREDVATSMGLLRKIHNSGIQVNHSFDIEKEISNYMVLCNKRNAIRFADNAETNNKMQALIKSVRDMNIPPVLCHIDSNPDNFIKLENGTIKLIDWEYSGICDPLIDISMYAIYSYYSKTEMDELLKIYLQREPSLSETFRLYIYAALGGYLWALWTQYKQSFGVEFGEYGMKMYRYAKDYYGYYLQLADKGQENF
jgi:thiamine kinase-like enzyme